MSYATLAELQASLSRYEISADTNPTLGQCQAKLDAISAELEGVAFARGYSLPITGTASLALVKAICLNGAGWYVLRTMFPNSTVGQVIELRDEYKEQMSDLRLGLMALPDAGRDTANQPATFSTLYPGCASSMAPFVTRGKVF